MTVRNNDRKPMLQSLAKTNFLIVNKMETHIMDRRQLMVKRIMVKVKPVGPDGQNGQNGPVWQDGQNGMVGQNGPFRILLRLIFH